MKKKNPQLFDEYINKTAVTEVLGSLCKDPSLTKEYQIKSDDFIETFHKIILSAINKLYKNGAKDIDAVAIDEVLAEAGHETQHTIFTMNKGMVYIDDAIQMSNIKNFDYFYSQLKKFSLLRSYAREGIDTSDFFSPTEVDPIICEKQKKMLDGNTVNDIVNFYKNKVLRISSPFVVTSERNSIKAGDGTEKQLELWKKGMGWGIGYASAYLTTMFHGIRRQRFTVLSASSGTGKTRLSVANFCYAYAPFYYDKEENKWCENINTRGFYYYDNENGKWRKNKRTVNGVLYIGTEMDLIEEINPILLAYMADVPEDHITDNCLEDGEEERVLEAARILHQYGNIWLEYVPNYDIGIIENLIAEHKEKHNIETVFFDYIHTTVELTSEFAEAAQAKMIVREDQILFNLSTKLKDLCRKYDVSIDSWTQVSGDFKNELNRDQTIIAGAKAIINKADQAGIVSRPTTRELQRIEPYTHRLLGKPKPNIVISVYKNRGGKFTDVKIWLYVDYSTMRVHDLFVTDYDCTYSSEGVIGLGKTYLNIYEGQLATTDPKKRPIPVEPPDIEDAEFKKQIEEDFEEKDSKEEKKIIYSEEPDINPEEISQELGPVDEDDDEDIDF